MNKTYELDSIELEKLALIGGSDDSSTIENRSLNSAVSITVSITVSIAQWNSWFLCIGK